MKDIEVRVSKAAPNVENIYKNKKDNIQEVNMEKEYQEKKPEIEPKKSIEENMYGCGQCGAEFSKKHKYCPECGVEFDWRRVAFEYGWIFSLTHERTYSNHGKIKWLADNSWKTWGF